MIWDKPGEVKRPESMYSFVRSCAGTCTTPPSRLITQSIVAYTIDVSILIFVFAVHYTVFPWYENDKNQTTIKIWSERNAKYAKVEENERCTIR